MIATARVDAHRHVERLLADQLPAARRTELDALLDGGGERSWPTCAGAPHARACASSWFSPTATSA